MGTDACIAICGKPSLMHKATACSSPLARSVGNGLGTGSGAMARLSARAAATLVPLIWLPLALLLALPASQDFLIACFAKDPEAALVRATRHLLWMQAGQLAFDGSQLGRAASC